ncbi:helix-turn-helix domain-containing protein [Parasphingorhabdus sp.]|jgi:excisionase family DNA binding protein|uniref:helix-turn-helix transcriptional regulator n=1 Tax=Parasphingorhabdus sp. TaxID=2709688 RepID=UPI0030A76C60
MHEHLLTIDEAAQRLRVHRSYVYKLINQGDLPKPIKVGRCSRFVASQFDEALRGLGGRS